MDQEEKDKQQSMETEGLNTEKAATEVDEAVDVEADLRDLKDKMLRLQADFENYRKRTNKERLDMVRYGSESLIVNLLGVLDNFDRAVESAQTTNDVVTMMQGIVMVQKQLKDVLQEQGLKKMNVLGEVFDPNIHEALAEEERGDVEDGAILEELQSGYRLHDKVIRCAKVKVAKKS